MQHGMQVISVTKPPVARFPFSPAGHNRSTVLDAFVTNRIRLSGIKDQPFWGSLAWQVYVICCETISTFYLSYTSMHDCHLNGQILTHQMIHLSTTNVLLFIGNSYLKYSFKMGTLVGLKITEFICCITRHC